MEKVSHLEAVLQKEVQRPKRWTIIQGYLSPRDMDVCAKDQISAHKIL